MTDEDAGFDTVDITDEATSLDDDNAVDLFLMTNMYTLLEDEGGELGLPSSVFVNDRGG